DASDPGDPMTKLLADEDGRRQIIRCALYSPAATPPGMPLDTDGWAEPRKDELTGALNRPAELEGSAGGPPDDDDTDLPILGPRLYARSQRAASTVQAADDWFGELNRTPVHRVVSGLGTRVIAKDQEPLMQAAWAQVGEIEKAN